MSSALTLATQNSTGASGREDESQPKILLLSSSLLTDRMFLYSDCLDRLVQGSRVQLWATSARNPRFRERAEAARATLEPFPEVKPFKEFPYNYLRRMNDFAWDFVQQSPSRISVLKHIRDKQQPWHIQMFKLPAWVVAKCRAEQPFENWLERKLLSYPRSPEAKARLTQDRPDLTVCTGPHRYDEPAIVAAARNLGIPVMALITSWDNLSTKNRPVLQYDGYLLWSEHMKQELHEYYPQTRELPAYVIGAPQFDVFFQERFEQSREEFCRAQGLDPAKPIILYALGSPNFIKEHYGAFDFAQRVAKGELGDVQLVIRPHPLFDNGKEAEMLRGISPRVIVQRTGESGAPLTARSQDTAQIVEWVNTFRHASVLVNFSSTVTIDAAICDKPVVNIDFDPEPGQPNQLLVKDVNHLWTHFRPIAESGGVWLVNNVDEIVHAVKSYLQDPSLHREKRRWIAQHVCGHVDGQCGERMAEAMLDFARKCRRPISF